MAKSGLKKVTKLRKYINSRPTDEVKDNTVGTEGYIPDVVSNEQCPVGCDAVVEGSVIVQGTTTTTTTTTIAVTPEPNLVRTYSVVNTSTSQNSAFRYTDEYGNRQDDTLLANEETSVVSQTQPQRTSGGQLVVTPETGFVEATTTTTTVAPVQSTDYTIDTSSATQSSVFTIQQPGSSTTQEVEIPSGRVVKITSDVAPSIVSGDQTPTITNQGALTPQADTYTLTNNDYYNSTTVEYREYLGVTDEVILSPRETLEVVSQDTPVVTGSVTNVNIVAAGTPTQEVDPAIIQQRICDQHVLTNDSDFAATFEYRDCDLINQEVTLDPREQTSVAAVSAPTLSAGSSGNVGSSFNVDTIDKNYGTTGSAATVSPTTSTTTTSTTTAAPTISPDSLTETNIVSVQDIKCNQEYVVTKPEGVVWYPEKVKIKVGTKTGDFKFISFDSGYEGNLYKVYEGNTLLLDKAIITESYSQKFMRSLYGALIDQGMSQPDANDYAYGSKRVEPQKDLTQTNPRNLNYRTEFTLTKTTFDEFITVEIYKPEPKGNWVTFKVECI